jgi:hypothetical protein
VVLVSKQKVVLQKVSFGDKRELRTLSEIEFIQVLHLKVIKDPFQDVPG